MAGYTLRWYTLAIAIPNPGRFRQSWILGSVASQSRDYGITK